MKQFKLIVACAFALTSTGLAEKSSPPVLSQESMGKNACGPCSFVNSLTQSGDASSLARLKGGSALEKARDFAERFGEMRSVPYGEHRTAYSDNNGTADRDLLAMINRFRVEGGSSKLRGDFLLKNEQESSRQFAERIRLRSLTDIRSACVMPS